MNDALQSVLSPHGFPAAPIATLAWTLFVFGSVVLLLVILAVWLAIRGTPRTRAVLAGERSILAFGLVLPAAALTLLLGYGVWLTRAQLAQSGADVRIDVTGEQWWWRVVYDGAQPVASANEIRIPVGRRVDFTLTSADVIHSFWVPSLAGKVDMIPGRTTRLQIVAERAGIYRGLCAEYCGGPHALMALDVVALAPDDYETWLAALRAPAVPPADDMQRRGEALFLAAGCGSCHTVRGTAASGTIGPDLTHLGSRRSVGHDALALDAANLRRFIHDGQSVKPGNRMPEFRVFSADESAALAAYLLGLR
jgi:cytochrome c oxidase subunit II